MALYAMHTCAQKNKTSQSLGQKLVFIIAIFQYKNVAFKIHMCAVL